MPALMATARVHHPPISDMRIYLGRSDSSNSQALEATGIEFIEENGGGPGVRLSKRPQPKKR